jgi:3-oxoacyl-[acyl-carrier-protein] synthase II
MRRVVITGIGVICSAGGTRDEFLQSLQHGRNGISRLDQADAWDLRFVSGGEVKNFDPTQYISPK